MKTSHKANRTTAGQRIQRHQYKGTCIWPFAEPIWCNLHDSKLFSSDAFWTESWRYNEL